MLFGKKESPVISIAKALAVPVLTIAGSGIAAYVGASKGVANTVEAACKGGEKFMPTFEAVPNKAEATEATTPAAPAEGDELAKYKEAIKQLMAKNAELEKAAAQPTEAKAEAEKAPEAPKKEKKEKKAEVKDDAKAESQAEAK